MSYGFTFGASAIDFVGTVSNIRGRQAGLIVAADLNGLAISLR